MLLALKQISFLLPDKIIISDPLLSESMSHKVSMAGQKSGPDLILGPTRFTPLTTRSFLQSTFGISVHIGTFKHQSQGKGDETQLMHENLVV